MTTDNWVELQAVDGHRLGAFVCSPAGRPRAGLLIAQEVFGVNAHIQSVARSYADAGYLAIAPRFFDRIESDVQLGYERPDVERGLAYTRKLDWTQTCLDVQAAARHFDAALRVGMVGYCWGGTMTWRSAAEIFRLDAAVCYYGGGIPALAELQPFCPVLLHWGENDPLIPTENSRAVANRHPETQSHFYPAGHGFNCDLRDSFDERAARVARERTLAFFEQHLNIAN
jgi:carboxymethylenebutenolidase